MNFSDRSSSPSVFISTARFVQPLSHSPHFLDQHQLSAHQRVSICGGGCCQAVLFLLGASCCTSPLSRGLEQRTAELELQLSRPFTATSTACRGSICHRLLESRTLSQRPSLFHDEFNSGKYCYIKYRQLRRRVPIFQNRKHSPRKEKPQIRFERLRVNAVGHSRKTRAGGNTGRRSSPKFYGS